MNPALGYSVAPGCYRVDTKWLLSRSSLIPLQFSLLVLRGREHCSLWGNTTPGLIPHQPWRCSLWKEVPPVLHWDERTLFQQWVFCWGTWVHGCLCMHGENTVNRNAPSVDYHSEHRAEYFSLWSFCRWVSSTTWTKLLILTTCSILSSLYTEAIIYPQSYLATAWQAPITTLVCNTSFGFILLRSGCLFSDILLELWAGDSFQPPYMYFTEFLYCCPTFHQKVVCNTGQTVS